MMTMGLAVGPEKERVGVGENWVATAACVDMPSRVCAADVYSALSVAAGCGVDAANGVHARMAASARIGIKYFFKLVRCMKASGLKISTQ